MYAFLFQNIGVPYKEVKSRTIPGEVPVALRQAPPEGKSLGWGRFVNAAFRRGSPAVGCPWMGKEATLG